MCGEFGEVAVIIGLVINFLAFVSPLLSFRDTLSYGGVQVFYSIPVCWAVWEKMYLFRHFPNVDNVRALSTKLHAKFRSMLMVNNDKGVQNTSCFPRLSESSVVWNNFLSN